MLLLFSHKQRMFILILCFAPFIFIFCQMIAEVCKHLSVYLRTVICTSINREKCDFCFISFSFALRSPVFPGGSCSNPEDEEAGSERAHSFLLFILVLKADFCHDSSVGLQTCLVKKAAKKGSI